MNQTTNGIERDRLTVLIKKLMDNLLSIKDEDGRFLLKLDDGRVIDTKGWAGWEWTHGIALYGIYNYYQLSEDEQAIKIVTDWFDARLSEGSTTKNVNTVSPFLTMAYLYEKNGSSRYAAYLDAWAEWIMHTMPRTEEGGLQHIVYNSVNEQQLWDDTLMMCVLPLAKIGQLLQRPAYIEEAKRQFLVHIKYLHDKESGLWFHGFSFKGRHNFANALWARGNSWVTIAIPEIIELLNLPKGDFFREYLVETLNSQVKALSQYQHADGLWSTIINDTSSYSESSATAGFAYGILKSIRKGYLKQEYEPMALKAIKGVIGKINNEGELEGVSFGTPVFNTIDEYKKLAITSMPYGQAMAILALAEYQRCYL